MASPGKANDGYCSDVSSLSRGSTGSMESTAEPSWGRSGNFPSRASIATIQSAIYVSNRIQRIRQLCNNHVQMNGGNDGGSDVGLVWPYKCIILLMDPQRKIFEVVVVDYQPDRSDDVLDLITKIPLVATSDYRLRFQKYIGLIHQGLGELKPGHRLPSTMTTLCGAPPIVSSNVNKGTNTVNRVGQPQCTAVVGNAGKDDDNNSHHMNPLLSLQSPLAAIPDGYTFQQIQTYSQIVLEDPKVVRRLVDLQYSMLLE
jgi:hypothetical protein